MTPTPTSTSPPLEAKLTRGQRIILIAAAVPMVVFAGLGAWGTYSNITGVFHRSATAWGVVAAGEGATLSLALVYVGLTLLGQSSPAAVRVGLWLLPAAASGTGAAVAQTATEAIVFAVTPLAMCSSAEGMGLLARRIVIRVTGVDMEAQRRNAKTMQQLAYHRARAANHPDEKTRKESELKSWDLAKKVGTGDATLGAGLVTVQRDRMTAGANDALAGMFDLTSVTPALTASVTDQAGRHTDGTHPVTNPPPRDAAVTGDLEGATQAGTQVSGDTTARPSQSTESVTDTVTHTVMGSVAHGVTETVTVDGSVTGGSVTDETPSQESSHPVTLEEVAAVAGVPTPVTGERLTEAQLEVVLRHLRYSDDPPLSYRQAVAAFRDAGFVGGEERVRRVWGHLMSHEEFETPEKTDA
ncbi:hypothetical protein ACIQ8G_26765 [Streptomyces sp. NPDC094154]|uniref:hypothetical protein n=1 Tax=Streptomyces sp. NPDC094154 TaxID=3366059 RepID=UPI003803409D